VSGAQIDHIAGRKFPRPPGGGHRRVPWSPRGHRPSGAVGRTCARHAGRRRRAERACPFGGLTSGSIRKGARLRSCATRSTGRPGGASL